MGNGGHFVGGGVCVCGGGGGGGWKGDALIMALTGMAYRCKHWGGKAIAVTLQPPPSTRNTTVYPKKFAHGFDLLCFFVVIHWLISPYPSGLLHWHCGNLTIAPVPAKQPWWIWINTSCEFIMNDCITTTKQSTTKPCAYFLGYTVSCWQPPVRFVIARRHHDDASASMIKETSVWKY